MRPAWWLGCKRKRSCWQHQHHRQQHPKKGKSNGNNNSCFYCCFFYIACCEAENEKIVIITALSGFRGRFSNIKAENAEIIFLRNAEKHCVETAHIVARLHSGGYVWTETGRRGSTGDVEIFLWDYYQRMPKEEFLQFQEISK